jgi:hypothetical protein
MVESPILVSIYLILFSSLIFYVIKLFVHEYVDTMTHSCSFKKCQESYFSLHIISVVLNFDVIQLLVLEYVDTCMHLKKGSVHAWYYGCIVIYPVLHRRMHF